MHRSVYREAMANVSQTCYSTCTNTDCKNEADTLRIVSIDVGTVNMAICVLKVTPCIANTSVDKPDERIMEAVSEADTLEANYDCSSDPYGSCLVKKIQDLRKKHGLIPVLGSSVPHYQEVESKHLPFLVDWEGITYVVHILRWGVYDLHADQMEAKREEDTGRRSKTAGRAEKQTIKTIVPNLVIRCMEWIQVWKDMNIQHICIEEQVTVTSFRSGAGGVGNVTAKVVSHIIQALSLREALQPSSCPWTPEAVHFCSPRLTNKLVDDILQETRPSTGVTKLQKKKRAVQAVQHIIDTHCPPLAGIFLNSTCKKRDDLADSFLQGVRFARDHSGQALQKRWVLHMKREARSAKKARTQKRCSK